MSTINKHKTSAGNKFTKDSTFLVNFVYTSPSYTIQRYYTQEKANGHEESVKENRKVTVFGGVTS